MKSHVYGLRTAILHVRRIAAHLADDRVSIYAAQASFFIIISAVPFLSLFLSAAGHFLPEELPLTDMLRGLRPALPDGVSALLETALTELRTPPDVPLLSFSAVTTLWSASRGIAAVRSGLERVYRAGRAKGFFVHRIKSLVSTVIFLAGITAAVTLLLFGDLLPGTFTGWILRLRVPLFLAVLSVLFTLIYASTARRSRHIRRGILTHLPGAVFSSVGWTLFSYCYSLYITRFPEAGSIYGSLAAVCLIMLWVYFCMMILLLGAELNKLCTAKNGDLPPETV